MKGKAGSFLQDQNFFIYAMRKFILTCMIAFCLSLFFPAASYAKGEKYTVSYDSRKQSLDVYKNGRHYMEISEKNKNGYIHEGFAIRGSKLYYTATYIIGDFAGYDEYLFQYDLSSKKKKKLKHLSDKYEVYDIAEYYDGSLYINALNPSADTACFRYDLKDGKFKKIADACEEHRYKNKIILDPLATYPEVMEFSIFVYDTKSRKRKRITKCAYHYDWYGKQIYYIEGPVPYYDQIPYGMSGCRVMKYDVSSGKKKKIADVSGIGYVYRITKKEMIFSRMDQSNVFHYYRYTFKNAKITELSDAEFQKAIQ